MPSASFPLISFYFCGPSSLRSPKSASHNFCHFCYFSNLKVWSVALQSAGPSNPSAQLFLGFSPHLNQIFQDFLPKAIKPLRHSIDSSFLILHSSFNRLLTPFLCMRHQWYLCLRHDFCHFCNFCGTFHHLAQLIRVIRAIRVRPPCQHSHCPESF